MSLYPGIFLNSDLQQKRFHHFVEKETERSDRAQFISRKEKNFQKKKNFPPRKDLHKKQTNTQFSPVVNGKHFMQHACLK